MNAETKTLARIKKDLTEIETAYAYALQIVSMVLEHCERNEVTVRELVDHWRKSDREVLERDLRRLGIGMDTSTNCTEKPTPSASDNTSRLLPFEE